MTAAGPIPLDTIAKIEIAADPLNCREVADNVRAGIRTSGDLRRCGCPRCLGALKLLGEEVV